jgi:Tfp pilus assembly protein PilV
MLQKQKGFTLIELMITIIVMNVMVIMLIGFFIAMAGNMWFTQERVEVQAEQLLSDDKIEIISVQRRAMKASIVTVRYGGEANDQIEELCVRSNIFYNTRTQFCTD